MTKALAKTVAALLAAAAGAVLALNGARIIHVSTAVLLACVVTSAALAAFATIGSAWGEWRGRRLAERRELAAISLEAAAWAIVDQVGGGLDYRDLGVAAYRIRRRWWWPFRAQLARVERVRPSRRPVASRVSWQPGKGVIGACVAKGEVVAVDVAQMYRDLGSPTEDEWETVPPEIRQGLSYDEYLDVRDKYAVVVAAPIIDDAGPSASVVGCVALDGPEGRFAELQSDEVLGLLNSTAATLLHQVR
jgi:hypothetical protein